MAEFLGVHPTKAGKRLYRVLLLRLAEAAGFDVCFRCGAKIINPDDVSIDHKEPWLWIDVALYWDPANLALAHRQCNRSAQRSRSTDKYPSEGLMRCSKCGEAKPIERFARAKTGLLKRHSQCNQCRNAAKQARKKRT